MIRIRVEGLTEIRRRMSTVDVAWANAAMTGLGRLGQVLQEACQREIHSDTGRLLRGIRHREQNRWPIVETVVYHSGAPYAKYVLDGTKPRGDDGKPPPMGAIWGWSLRHGLNPYFVRWSIKKRGTSIWALKQTNIGSMANKWNIRAWNSKQGEILQTARNIGARVAMHIVRG